MRRKFFLVFFLAAARSFCLPVKIEVEPFLQIVSGGAAELVFDSAGLLSRLDWDEKIALSPGGKIEVSAGKFFFAAECGAAIPKRAGFLRDFDFLNFDEKITHYSIHDCDLESDVNFSLRAGRDFRFEKFALSPFAELDFSRAKWLARDGHSEYYIQPNSPVDFYPQWDGPNFSGEKSPCRGKVIAYEQRIFCPALGLEAEADFFKRMRAGASFSFAPYVWANAYDEHFLRGISFWDSLKGGKMISLEFRLAFAATEKARVCVAAGEKCFWNLRGETCKQGASDSQWLRMASAEGGARRRFFFLRLSASLSIEKN